MIRNLRAIAALTCQFRISSVSPIWKCTRPQTNHGSISNQALWAWCQIVLRVRPFHVGALILRQANFDKALVLPAFSSCRHFSVENFSPLIRRWQQGLHETTCLQLRFTMFDYLHRIDNKSIIISPFLSICAWCSLYTRRWCNFLK